MAKRSQKNAELADVGDGGAFTWHTSWGDQYTYLIVSPSPKGGSHLLLKDKPDPVKIKVHYVRVGDQEVSGREKAYKTYTPGGMSSFAPSKNQFLCF
jgi:hypothetical protein